MRGNVFGKLFSITTYGESHGLAMGVVVDGVPAGIDINFEQLDQMLKERRSGRIGTTTRVEQDTYRVTSGLFEGKSLGTPVHIEILNKAHDPSEYTNLKNNSRSNHADQTTVLKYGNRDYRGGGRSSGRESVSRIVGGFFAKQILPQNIEVNCLLTNIGNKFIYTGYDFTSDAKEAEQFIPQDFIKNNLDKFFDDLRNDNDSVGAECTLLIKNIPKALGEPVFDKLKADIAKAIMSIGGVMSISFGLGVDVLNYTGKSFHGKGSPLSGILGGISDGSDVLIKTIFRPAASVEDVAKNGRHDVCFAIRAAAVVKSMVLIVIADHYLRQRAYGGLGSEQRLG